jgi:TPR repeat protein
MGNLEGALADLSLGIRLDAKGASSAYQRRSDLRARVGHLAGAYADWAEIAAADDHSAAALAKRAAAALVVDDRDVVIAAAGVAATLADNAAMAVEKAIKSPEIKTEDKEGTKAALEAIFMNPATGAKRDALLLRGVAYGRLERWTEAEADFSAVLAVAPDNAAAYANRAAARRALGNLAGADEDSRMAVGLDAKRYGSEVRGFPDLSLARDAAEAARRVAACDAVAASDLDASRPADVPGIAAMEVNPEVAIEACAGAVAANPGDARMFFNLGRSLHQANDFKTAAAAYVKAVKLGHALAAANFGILYQDGNGVERDLTRARELFQRAADAGAPRGMFLLGNLYERGSGVPQDYAKAWEWYDKAARGNDVLALYSLGQMSADGRGVGQDYGEALRWFRKAEAAGNTTASLRIGDLLGAGQGAPADWTAACTAYDKAAAAGAAEGLRKIGECYMSGRGGRKDAALAMDYFEKAAAAGDSQAAYDAGRYFYDGTSIAKDIKRSLEWLRRAADMGNADGMNDLGALYYNGEGVQPDRAIARQWFDKAAAAGSELAKKNLQNYR